MLVTRQNYEVLLLPQAIDIYTVSDVCKNAKIITSTGCVFYFTSRKWLLCTSV